MQGKFNNWMRIALLSLVFSVCATAEAATYTLNGTDRPTLCSGQVGSWSGNTYICNWGQPFRVATGDAVVSTRPQIKILSYSGFDFVGSTIGGSGYVIDLEAQGSNETKLRGSILYGSIVGSSNNVRLVGGATINGSISVTGTFSSNASTITGNVSANNGITATDTIFQGNLTTSSGGISLVGGEVTNDVLVTATNITANDTVFRGALTSTNGAINLTGGSVEGLVKTNCCTITTNGSNLSSGAQANSGITIDGGTIAGGLKIVNVNGGFVNNDIVIKNAIMPSGDINAFNVQVSNSQIGTAQSPVEIIARGNYLNLVDNTTVYGHVEVTNTYGTITIEPGSRVVGTCLADTNRNPNVNNNVIGECGGGGVPPDPPDPVECGVSLEVGPMIAGKPHFAKITALDEPLSCKPPSVLEVLFKYPNPDTKHHNPESIWVNGEEIKEGEAKEVSNIEWSEKEVRLNIEYKEAGALYLAVLGSDDEILSEDNFVSRPYGFCIKPLQYAPISEDGSAESIDFYSPVRFKAGDPISVSITAVRWDDNGLVYGSAENPLLARDICANAPTENYRQETSTSFKEVPELIQPVGAPGTASGSFKHLSDVDNFVPGNAIANVILDEVGFFRIQTEAPPAYLGEDMSPAVSRSAIIGRIIPAWLEVGERPSQNTDCSRPSSFTYQGQPTFLLDQLEVRGFNRNGVRTQNYKGDFWRFSGTLKFEEREETTIYELHQASAGPEAGQLSAIYGRIRPVPEDAKMPVFTATPSNAAFLPNSDTYSYGRPSSPTELDNPFSLKMVIWNWHDQDGVYFKRGDEQPEDERGFEPDQLVPVEILIGDSEFRFGRVRSENVVFPTETGGDVPLRLEHWNKGWLSAVDDCTKVVSAPADYPDASKPGWLSAAEVEDRWTSEQKQHFHIEGSKPTPLLGRVLVRSLLTGLNGSPATWLCQPSAEVAGGICNYGSVNESIQARAATLVTFGLHQGPTPLIFRREVYR